MHNTTDIQEATQHIKPLINCKPAIGIILGSGLGSFADTLKNRITIPYDAIPHFAKSAAIGHANELIVGDIAGKTILVMKGRFHYYEGCTLDQVTLPIRVMQTLGIKKLILTNASGAVNTHFDAGQLMLITDHINLAGTNPLIGPNNSKLGVRFLDLSEVYSEKLGSIVKSVAKQHNIILQEGVYAWMAGPSYETPAEIRMIRTLGGDAVGMSTVPEAIIAHHAGIETVGISCMTNMASGILEQRLNHQEVIDTAEKVEKTFIKLITHSIAKF